MLHVSRVHDDCVRRGQRRTRCFTACHRLAQRDAPVQDRALSQGVSFFSFLRRLTCDGFYTSKIGIADLGYIGNTALREFPGCPPVPES